MSTASHLIDVDIGFFVAIPNEIYDRIPSEISAIHQPTTPSDPSIALHCYISEKGETFFFSSFPQLSKFVSVSLCVCVSFKTLYFALIARDGRKMKNVFEIFSYSPIEMRMMSE